MPGLLFTTIIEVSVDAAPKAMEKAFKTAVAAETLLYRSSFKGHPVTGVSVRGLHEEDWVIPHFGHGSHCEEAGGCKNVDKTTLVMRYFGFDVVIEAQVGDDAMNLAGIPFALSDNVRVTLCGYTVPSEKLTERKEVEA